MDIELTRKFQKQIEIGIIIKEKTVVFAAFDHRSDIYKYFP